MNKLIHYRTLRNAVGIIALLFPAILMIFGYDGFSRGSLSAYYWSSAGDIFVGVLVTMGIFLITYNGYDNTDKWLTTLSGASMILVGLFPMFMEGLIPNLLTPKASGVVHGISATIAFTSLGIMSLTQFTKSSNIKRNRVYRICGWVIIGAIVSMVPVKIFVHTATSIFFFQECIVLWAFGTSWAVKGMN